MGLEGIAAVCSAGTCVCVMRDVTWHSQIVVCCFPGALQHVTIGSRSRGNTLQPVAPRHRSLCSVQWANDD